MRPPLIPQTKATFRDIDTSRLWRSFINLGECLRQLFYFLDVLSVGDPAGQPCQYTAAPGGGIAFKASLACGLGNLGKATWLAVGSLAYELLRTVQTVLTAFALPAYASAIRIPTFNDALNDVEVAVCEVGAIVGSIFPVKFNCSSQVRIVFLLLYFLLFYTRGAARRVWVTQALDEGHEPGEGIELSHQLGLSSPVLFW